MLSLRPLVLPAWLALLLCACGSGAEDEGAADRAAFGEVESGLVIVVAPPAVEDSMSDEAYADWAAYLNEFSAEHPELRFERVERGELADIMADPPELSEPYAAIFVRSDGAAAFYDGMVFESFVYEEGADFIAGRVPEPEYLELRE